MRMKSPTSGFGSGSLSLSSTLMASEVAGSPSPTGSWIQKSRPLSVIAVTTPVVVPTVPAYGDSRPLPWISMMVSTGGRQANELAAPGVPRSPSP